MRLYDFVTVEVNNTCNLHCMMCGRQGSWSRKPQIMSLDSLRVILNELERTCSEACVQLVGNGESLLHPHINELIWEVINRKMQCTITTNATLPMEDLPPLNSVRVSVDAGDKPLYEFIRKGASWESLLRNVQEFRRTHPNTHLGVNSVLMHINMDSLLRLPPLLTAWKVNEWFIQAVKPLNSWAEEQMLMQWEVGIFNFKLARAPGYQGSVFVRGGYHPGLCMQSGQFIDYGRVGSPYILVDGSVMPCCSIGEGDEYTLGNVFQESLQKIWYMDEKARAWRKSMLSPNYPEICKKLCLNLS